MIEQNNKKNIQLFGEFFLFIFLLYFWGMLYAHNPRYDISNLQYYFYVLPSVVFVFVGSCLSLFKYVTKIETLMIAGLLTFVNFISIARNDFTTILSVSLLLFTVGIFSHLRFKLDANKLNYIYLLSVLFSAISYHLGFSEFGYIPGMSHSSESQGLVWRISLFPSLPESAFFSAIIFVVNLSYSSLVFRRTVIFLSLYFLLFSGLRSAVIATIMAIVFLTLSLWKISKNRYFLMFFCYFLLSSFFFLVLAPNMLLSVLTTDNDVLNRYFFRSISGDLGQEDLQVTVYRGWLWLQHINIWLDNWIVGVGTFEFKNVVMESIISGHNGSGSESFFTGFLARVGIFSIVFLVVFFTAAIRSIRHRKTHVAPIFILFFVAMFSYGSFIVSYNFIFLLFLVLIFGQLNVNSLAGVRN
ncbi:MAG: O-antigen ligase family protein [Spirochaetes bacterium]|nr:O-antigen ligase family protein [Spirochaetota bacterium]